MADFIGNPAAKQVVVPASEQVEALAREIIQTVDVAFGDYAVCVNDYARAAMGRMRIVRLASSSEYHAWMTVVAAICNIEQQEYPEFTLSDCTVSPKVYKEARRHFASRA
jgi:hypothetical protein